MHDRAEHSEKAQPSFQISEHNGLTDTLQNACGDFYHKVKDVADRYSAAVQLNKVTKSTTENKSDKAPASKYLPALTIEH